MPLCYCTDLRMGRRTSRRLHLLYIRGWTATRMLEMTDAAIMVRAKITRAEWDRLRKLAIDRNESTSEMIGLALRDFVNLHDPPPVDGGRKRGRRAA